MWQKCWTSDFEFSQFRSVNFEKLTKKALSSSIAACNIPSMAESPSNFMDWRPLSLNLTRFTSLYIILHSYYGPTFAVHGFGSIALSLRSQQWFFFLYDNVQCRQCMTMFNVQPEKEHFLEQHADCKIKLINFVILMLRCLSVLV